MQTLSPPNPGHISRIHIFNEELSLPGCLFLPVLSVYLPAAKMLSKAFPSANFSEIIMAAELEKVGHPPQGS